MFTRRVFASMSSQVAPSLRLACTLGNELFRLLLHSRVGGNPGGKALKHRHFLDSRLRGNDGTCRLLNHSFFC